MEEGTVNKVALACGTFIAITKNKRKKFFLIGIYSYVKNLKINKILFFLEQVYNFKDKSKN
ncbi:hypothetical protein THII_2563 [Thioploca ingrica]|uniref:Uncharacterized protein n=1 Tax=Thioploca ingrica TaxID=40754 RepID=A0A090AND7_9GAMM|nr:hypothetical protein THII_2563 [Thioploca ingrica]